MSPASNNPNERFSDRYAASAAAALIEAELEVLGTDYQANGYTTRSEADEIGDRLDLQPGSRLLDLGSGCGFPGLYLARRHGCTVTTLDPVASGASASARRSDRDGMRDRHLAVIGSGSDLPFRRHAFDAIVHVDVMC
jgi:cyclopropane fatty-acyl-phospholipid synthase-like methyltransferase